MKGASRCRELPVAENSLLIGLLPPSRDTSKALAGTTFVLRVPSLTSCLLIDDKGKFVRVLVK